MSEEYLTHAERFEAAVAELEVLRDELLTTCTHAHYLIADLQAVLTQANITQRTNPAITERVRLLARLFAEHMVPAGTAPPTVGEIAGFLGEQASWFEE
jgi:hypothetical protein